jgi:hypothetical protein
MRVDASTRNGKAAAVLTGERLVAKVDEWDEGLADTPWPYDRLDRPRRA